MKHTLTVERLDLKALRTLEERRCAVNSQPSRLKDLAILFFEQFKKHRPSLMLHQSDNAFKESYRVMVGEYEIRLQVLCYNEREIAPSLVYHPETVLQVNRLQSSLASFSPSEGSEHDAVFGMAHKCFVMCGNTASFQTDIDDGIWSMQFCDKKNRTSASMEITHISLLPDAKPVKAARR